MNERLDTRALIEAITTWAATRPHGWRASGASGGFSFIQLHTRPQPNGPEVQLTLRAAIVDGQAVIQVPELQSPEITQAPSAAVRDTASTQVQVIMPASSTREGDAVCEGCGALGTVGRASRTAPSGEALEIHRFCARCWPEQSARYRARWSEEDRTWSDQFLRGRVPARGAGPGMHFESATWHGTLEFVRQIERTMVTPVPPSPQGLARIAADIAGRASNFDGEMPFAVEAFVQRYGAHAD